MIRSALLWGVLAIVAGVGLFFLKYEVRELEHRLAQIERTIRDDREAIHVLRAEWSHLNDPTRLARLAEEHLGLGPTAPTQLVTVNSLAAPRLANEIADAAEGGPSR